MLREATRAYLSGLEIDGSRIRARFVFPESFEGFRGHFPGNPVLPGLCMVQAALAVLEAWKGGRARLVELSLAKFFTTAAPGQELQVVCRDVREADGLCFARALVSRGEEKIAQLTLKASFANEGVSSRGAQTQERVLPQA